MKTKISQHIILICLLTSQILSLLFTSCNLNISDYHDGEYVADVPFIGEIKYTINGNEILVDNGITGIRKIECEQFPDRIEYMETNGVKQVLSVLENGDIKQSEFIILKRVKSNENSNEIDEVSEIPSTHSNYEEKGIVIDKKIKTVQERSIKQALEDSKNIDLPPMDESVYEEENLYKIVDGVPMVKVGDDWYEDIIVPIDSSEICSH